ncbi:hypothetical protein [Acidiphilium sp.]|uniref:hypothetical protein n=1 Tax=Acidiphilium sp. TaxID=527 RepID=UPI0025829E20|nr:hypothetical protein [Acidiphilium sp.]
MADGADNRQSGLEKSIIDSLMRMEQRLGRIEGKLEDQLPPDRLQEKLNQSRRDIHEDLLRMEARLGDKVDDANDVRAADMERLRSEFHGIARKVFREEQGEQDKTLDRAEVLFSRAKTVLWAGGGIGVLNTLYMAFQAFGGG